MPNGKVYLVGIGPGDPELITLKAYQLICEADVILHDHLVPAELLSSVKLQAELISVGKSAGRHTMAQEEINELLIQKTKGNKIVVRLKVGDPYLFGRGGEEALYCFNASVDFEVVPGVTSALAAPAYAGIPSTHRDYTSNLAIVTGHRKKGLELEIPKAGTVIFLMGVANIEKIITSLLKDGWPKETKIAAVEHGTYYNQRIVKGTLENFLDVVKKAKLGTPATFIVGKVVEMQEKLDWFSRKPKVLVLGTHPQKYRHLGTIVHRQIIDCVVLDDYTQTDTTIKNIGKFDWLIFTSVNGVKYFFQRLTAAGLDTRTLAGLKIAAIGKTTAERLSEFGLTADMVPENESSEGLLDMFKQFSVKDKRILLPQSQIASKVLSESLAQAGAAIDAITVYKTVEIEPSDIDLSFINIILFTSGSTVRAFVKKFGKVPGHIKSYCLGTPTLEEAKKNSINAEIMPQQQT